MKHVNRIFAVVVLLFAAYYGYLAWKGWTRGTSAAPKSDGIPGAVEATPDTFEDVFAEAEEKGKPILVDCWATWCKNCFAMERTTLADKRIREALERYTVIRLQADDMKGFKELEPFKDVQGLPTYAIFEISETGKDTEK
jgi:thiol:disulfide interchange protein